VASTKDIGRAGEFFAAYVLESHGVECHHVDRDGADLWCKVQGSMTTVQVKACSRAVPSRPGSTDLRYRYHTLNGKGATWFCFVALDRGLLLLRHVSVIGKGKTLLRPELFTAVEQERTIEAFKKSC